MKLERSGGSSGMGMMRIGDYAEELRAMLAPMPGSYVLVPAWFKSSEALMGSCEVPVEMQGAIIMPFLN